jgi:cell division protein FtsN
MLSFNGILRGAVYFFVGGWMFFLGILVGRGTSPVTFDTQTFHTRLETIVQKLGKTDDPEEKMDLQFYDALNRPVRQEVVGKKNNPNEIIPKKETGPLLKKALVVKAIPVKTSMKTATLNKNTPRRFDKGAKASSKTGGTFKPAKDKIPAKVRIEPEKLRKKVTDKKKPKGDAPLVKPKTPSVKKAVVPGVYTIQIAAYKAFTDAVTQMSFLEKKGIASYRVLGKKEGVTWYRVRVGSFATRDAASRYLEKLKKAKIDGMIIKKE